MEAVQLEPGVYVMPDKDYFALDAVSNSDLKQLARSPAHYKAYKAEPESKETPAKLTGRALHTSILEPQEFFNRYAVLPPTAPNKPTESQLNAKNPAQASIEAIEYWNEFIARAGEKAIITTEQADKYLMIGDTIRSHPELSKFLNGGMAERVVIAKDPITGVLCRCKTDYAVKVNGLRVIIDVKSTEDARARPFSSNAFNYGYFTQAPYYADIWEWAGYPIDLWLFAAFEKEAPYAVKLYEVLPEDMERGRVTYRKALNTYADCLAKDEWPAYRTDIEPLTFPAWAKN